MMLKKSALPGDLFTKPSFTSSPIQVPRLDISQAHKTLGCFVTANGNQTPQLDHLLELSRHWASKSRSSGLSAKDILLSFYSRLLPQLSYRFSISNFSYDQCDTLMRTILPVLINAFHIQRHFPYTLATAPLRYAGLNIPHHFYTFLLLKTQKFIYHMRQQDKTGQLLRISTELTQLQLGSSSPFFTLPHKTWIPLVTQTWSTHLFQMLEDCFISVTYPSFWIPQLQRENDTFIMDIFLQNVQDKTILYKLNACRISLQVLTLADITSLDGRLLLPNISLGTNYRVSSYRWPQQKVPKTWWKVWAQHLTSYVTPQLQSRPLGTWTTNPHQTWKWKTNSTSTWLSGPNNKFFSLSPSSSRNPSFLPSTLTSPTQTHHPVDIHQHHNKISIFSSHPIVVSPSPPSSPPDLLFLQYHPQYHGKGLPKILRLLRKGKLLTATDGSAFVGQKASFGFCFSSPHGSKLYTNYGPVHGDPEYLASDRAELTALLSAITFIRYLLSTHSITPRKSLVIYTDSKSSLDLLQKPLNRISDTLTNNIDLLLELKHHLRLSPKIFSLLHVEGHQDRHTAVEYLPLPSRLNILADETADLQYNHPLTEHHTSPPHFPAQLISLSSPHGRIATHFKDELIRFHRDPPTETYIASTWNIPLKHLSLVNWKAIHRVLTSQPRFSGAFPKLIHEQWDVSSRKRRWGLTNDDSCPLCHTTSETTSHIHCCNHPTLSQARKKAQIDCITSLNKAQTAPIITSTIRSMFTSWQNKSHIQIPSRRSTSIDRALRRALKSQKKLGFANFSRGIISIKWAKVQEKYCKHNNLKTSPSWSNKLTSSVLQYSHSLWKHRCSILQAEKIGTMENYHRDTALSLFDELRKNPERLEFRHRKLLRYRPNFFTRSHITSVRMWYQKALSSLDYRKKKNATLGADIRNWTLCRPRDPGRRSRGVRVPNCRRLFKLRAFT